MARKKSSGAGGVLGVLLLGVLAMLAAIPKEVWVLIGLLGIALIVLYIYRKANTSTPVAPTSMPQQAGAVVQGPGNASSIQRQATAPYTPSTTDDLTTVAIAPPAAPKASAHRLPPSPAGMGPGRWIPPGQDVEVAGVSISGGFVYVGTSLKTPAGVIDPCLINPSLPLAATGDFKERQFGYWPSYADVPPAARRAYLTWLAGGRQAPEADIGFVFLFFYGLERRAVIEASDDPVARADWPAIAQELRRLLKIYGSKSGSFQRYATELLGMISLTEADGKLYQKRLPDLARGFEVPIHVKLALGQAAIDGVPVPSNVALAWAKHDPNLILRTPAQRCPEQFDALFSLRYFSAFGAGLVLPRNRTKLKFVYRPASSAFQGVRDVTLEFGDTPDVTVLTGPRKKLADFVESVQSELDAYSRFVGRQPEAKDSLEALLLLPAPLWPSVAQAALERLKVNMSDDVVVLAFQDLLANLGASTGFTKEKTIALARALKAVGVGLAPDVLDGARPPKPEDPVALFLASTSDSASSSTPAYQAALLTLQLSSAVAAADGDFGDAEAKHLKDQVMSWTHLSGPHLQRLQAHLRLLKQVPASLSSLKKRLDPLDLAAKDVIGRFMATLAQADGSVSPAELKMLEKAYAALGLDPKRVITDVHAASTHTHGTPASPAKAKVASLALDVSKIAALQEESSQVSALLASIFVDEAEAHPASAATQAEPVDAAEATLMGLDVAHTAFARMLLSRPSWTSSELEGIAADLELMLSGALERINDASFDAYGLPFIEGEDPAEVNIEVLEKLEA